jgi:hypothetical protein
MSTRTNSSGDSNSTSAGAGKVLLGHHQKMIEASAISPDVVRERGYRSAKTKAELGILGFKPNQRNVPALLIPVHNVHGEIATYQLRPDQPRIGAEGKAIKYETPQHSRMVLDVPPRVRPKLGDPKTPLFITEGARKADAGVSAGLCTIAVLGVWNWRGTNDLGGKTALADWDSIALNNRLVYLVFDSDVMTKPQVHLALARLKQFLESKSATVRVVYLPEGSNGAKVGLDDYLAAGGTAAELVGMACAELRPLPPESGGRRVVRSYFVEEGQTFQLRTSREGELPVLLGNFAARIVSEVTLDDGVDTKREFEIDAVLGAKTTTFYLPASSFAAMTWPPDRLGARACVSAGMGQRDHLRAAIQSLSDDIAEKTIYTHSGWRLLPDHGYTYLHGGGAIGPDGPVAGIEVRLGESARGMVLPAPPSGDELRTCIQASLKILDLVPHQVSFALLSATFRAALGDTDFSILLFGPTGSFKTEYAALLQGHFGLGFNARNLPGSWLSTANMLEMQAFALKDALFVIDDWVPSGSRQDMQRLVRDFERLLRSQGNCAGRGRLTSEASPKEGHPPRGMIFVTCEDLPTRHSALARTLVLEVRAGDGAALTACQRERDQGTYAKAMSGFLSWTARQHAVIKQALEERARRYRDSAQVDDRHRRTASIIGELQAGFETLLDFALACGAIDAARQAELQQECWKALLGAAAAQSGHHAAVEPAALFLGLLASAISSGRAHIAGMDGQEPPNAEALGWRAGSSTSAFGKMALGTRVGWVDGDDLYLDLTSAYKAAQEMASDTEHIPVSTKTLSKRLNEAGHLRTTEKGRDRLTIRKSIAGKRINVLHLALGVITGQAQSAPTAQDQPQDAAGEDSGPESWADSAMPRSETGPDNRPTFDAPDTCNDGAGPVGPIGPLPRIHPSFVPAELHRVDDEEETEQWGAA